MSALYYEITEDKRFFVQSNNPFCSKSTDRSPTELLMLADNHRLFACSEQDDIKKYSHIVRSSPLNVKNKNEGKKEPVAADKLLETHTVWATSHTNGELLWPGFGWYHLPGTTCDVGRKRNPYAYSSSHRGPPDGFITDLPVQTRRQYVEIVSADDLGEDLPLYQHREFFKRDWAWEQKMVMRHPMRAC